MPFYFFYTENRVYGFLPKNCLEVFMARQATHLEWGIFWDSTQKPLDVIMGRQMMQAHCWVFLCFGWDFVTFCAFCKLVHSHFNIWCYQLLILFDVKFGDFRISYCTDLMRIFGMDQECVWMCKNVVIVHTDDVIEYVCMLENMIGWIHMLIEWLGQNFGVLGFLASVTKPGLLPRIWCTAWWYVFAARWYPSAQLHFELGCDGCSLRVLLGFSLICEYGIVKQMNGLL